MRKSIVFLALACLSLASGVFASDSATEARLSSPLINEVLVGAVALPGEDLVFEGNVYHCYRDVNHYDRTVCVKIGTTNEPVPGELQAAEEAALFQIPVRPRLDWEDGAGMTEYCRGSVHGDCSGACRITALLPNGDVAVECGERTQLDDGGATTFGDPICTPNAPCCLPSDGANCPKRRLP